MTESTQGPNSREHPARKPEIVTLWLLQAVSALAFLMVGGAKLAGTKPMVQLFETIGMGQSFRYVTGGLEVLGALALLVPALAGAAALLLACVMLGAIATHLFVIGGIPAMPLALLVVTSVIAWRRRERTRRLLGIAGVIKD